MTRAGALAEARRRFPGHSFYRLRGRRGFYLIGIAEETRMGRERGWYLRGSGPTLESALHALSKSCHCGGVLDCGPILHGRSVCATRADADRRAGGAK